MDKKNKPTLCEVLGVEVEEVFWVNNLALHIDKNGYVLDNKQHFLSDTILLCDLIDDPSLITRAPMLSKSEIAILNSTKADFVTKDKVADPNYSVNEVKLWTTRPDYSESDKFKLYKIDDNMSRYVGTLSDRLFPSLQPGECSSRWSVSSKNFEGS